MQDLGKRCQSFLYYLEELGDVCDDVAEDEVLRLLGGVEPSELGDAREEGDEALHDECRQLRPRVQVLQHIVAWRK